MAFRLALFAAICLLSRSLPAKEPFTGSDIAFEHLVDRDRLAVAIENLDAETLADVAIQFCEAERILLRPHQLIRAEALMNLAIRAAVEKRRAEILHRLETYARHTARTPFVEQITAARSLAGAARSTADSPLLPIEDVTEGLLALYHEYKQHLETARVIGDGQMLTGLESSLLNDDNGLPEALQSHLLNQIADARNTLPEAGIPSSTVDTLLFASSRDMLNQPIVGFCRARLGRRVGDGQCATLVTEAFKAAGARRFPPYGRDADYVWGRFVYGLEMSGGLEMEDGAIGTGRVRPGDIVQFRNARFEGRRVNANGSWNSWTSQYPHHTAVVATVNGRRWTVYHQNVGPSGKSKDQKEIVQIGSINLNELASGWLKVYRPVSALSRVSRGDGDTADDLAVPRDLLSFPSSL
jgi:hypothetical protein